jgi:heme/copper-type cytochrome/quinol oxidase subunit 2
MLNKAKKSKRNRRIIVLVVSAVAIFLLLIAAIVYVLQHQQPTQQKPDSSTYFTISDLAALCRATTSNTTAQNLGASVRITQFAFNFTPVGGDATNVRIFASGNLDPLENNWEGETIPNGTSTFSGEMQPPYTIPSNRQSDGTYTLTIRIAAEEADGSVTLNFTAGENLFLGG